MSKKTLLILVFVAIIAVVVYYVFYPFTEAGCNNIKTKIDKQAEAASFCDLASDCAFEIETGCSFDCAKYFSSEINKDLASRYENRCSDCKDECYFSNASPACLNHICSATGGAVYIKTLKEEYAAGEAITLDLKSNLLEEIEYGFPISLCLRPAIMRLEKYNTETKEWLSSGIGLLFENSRIVFYEDPIDCQVYEIKNCTPEEADKFIDESTLKITEGASYSVSSDIAKSCDSAGQEILEPMQGRYRIAAHYDQKEKIGRQIYSNEFTVKLPR
ncbi:hypothetical protein HQ544_02785 [Candidatus Falkowbacteria bacterium]|nr:hypothetical protein [Candidatus Falkowbacteria bacterium]